MHTVNLKNEIVGMVSNAPRWDVVAYKGVASLYEVIVENTNLNPLLQVTIILYATDTRQVLLFNWFPEIVNDTTFRWSITPSDLADFKPVIYAVTAIDQDANLLFFGSFELIGGL